MFVVFMFNVMHCLLSALSSYVEPLFTNILYATQLSTSTISRLKHVRSTTVNTNRISNLAVGYFHSDKIDFIDETSEFCGHFRSHNGFICTVLLCCCCCCCYGLVRVAIYAFPMKTVENRCFHTKTVESPCFPTKNSRSLLFPYEKQPNVLASLQKQPNADISLQRTAERRCFLRK